MSDHGEIAIFKEVRGRNVLVEGHIVIEGVQHYVVEGFVKCNPALNEKAWDVTKKESICPYCFNTDPESFQLRGSEFNKAELIPMRDPVDKHTNRQLNLFD